MSPICLFFLIFFLDRIFSLKIKTIFDVSYDRSVFENEIFLVTRNFFREF